MQSSIYQRFYGWKYLINTNWGRKVLFIGLCGCFFLYYIIPLSYNRVYDRFFYGSGKSCMERHLQKSAFAVDNFNAVINRHHVEKQVERPHLPFVGNGKLASVVDYKQSSLYMFYEVSFQPDEEYVQLPFDIIIRPELVGKNVQNEESTVLNFHNGIVQRLSCLTSGYTKDCVFVNHTVIAHRSRPNVLLQHIEVSSTVNREESSMIKDVFLNQDHIKPHSNFKLLAKDKSDRYLLYGSVLPIEEKNCMAVVVAVSVTPQKLLVKDNSAHVDSYTVVMHSDVMKSTAKCQMELRSLTHTTSSYFDELLRTSGESLLQEHKDAWRDILHTGLSIKPATDHEPGIPAPRTVNSTIYYVLSTMDSKLHNKDIPEKERFDLIKRLHTPDFCYNGNPTFHAEALWKQPTKAADVADVQKLWALTLRKRGCNYLVSEGAEGMLQAIVLSFGGLQFTNDDLQLHTHPDILHNQIAFHNIIYKNNTVDIAIKDVSGSSTLEVALLESSPLPLYACEAGCLSEIKQLKKEPQRFPVYVTQPVTPILYISHSRKHLEELKQTLHVRNIIDHAQHLETLNKPAGPGGLPLMFWISIGSLIIFFHVFLIRMIFKEYNNSMGPGSMSKSYYTNRGRLAS
ncbi:uncharacterized protein KIAA2013 homolog [Clavelina lepadiformis]|uniref:uncharacterized protein KIAA2013 homolog n=1 Tax=Clavelina lepadiformis TaxID=159417 RepID=UPI004042F02D